MLASATGAGVESDGEPPKREQTSASMGLVRCHRGHAVNLGIFLHLIFTAYYGSSNTVISITLSTKLSFYSENGVDR